MEQKRRLHQWTPQRDARHTDRCACGVWRMCVVVYIYGVMRGRAFYLYRDRKGADPAEWPEDLRVQEFPR